MAPFPFESTPQEERPDEQVSPEPDSISRNVSMALAESFLLDFKATSLKQDAIAVSLLAQPGFTVAPPVSLVDYARDPFEKAIAESFDRVPGSVQMWVKDETDVFKYSGYFTEAYDPVVDMTGGVTGGLPIVNSEFPEWIFRNSETGKLYATTPDIAIKVTEELGARRDLDLEGATLAKIQEEINYRQMNELDAMKKQQYSKVSGSVKNVAHAVRILGVADQIASFLTTDELPYGWV
jgi:hypothetical protein